jgi:capsule biosynthesis phosphatase
LRAVRICIDLDGVICALREPGQSYAELEPVPGAVDHVRSLRAAGHYVIIQTARHMKSCDGNIGQVLAKQGLVTLQWLERHGVEYDEIHFGKPHADVYLDDNAVRFDDWGEIDSAGANLPASREAQAEAERRA